MADQQAKKVGHPNKGSLQAYLQDFTKEAIDGLVKLMRETKQDQLKFAAFKLIIDKSIADIKAIEVTGQNGEPIKLNIIAGADFSQYRISSPSSTGSTTYRPTQVQGTGVAQTGEENDNSDKPIDKVDTA